MKLIKPFLLVFALIVMAMPAMAESKLGDPEIGQPAPSFTLQDVEGNTHKLNNYRGKTVVLEWTNHECPYVRKHYETHNMQKLQQQAAAEGVVWLTVNSSAPGKQGHVSPEEAKAIMAQNGAQPAAYLYDSTGETGMAYGAKATPHMFVINPEGTLVYKGAIDDRPTSDHDTVKTAHNYVIAALEAVKDGHMPEVTQSNPYGCSIKYNVM